MSTLNPERSQVLWFGAPPHSEHRAELANRGLTVCEVDPGDLEEVPFDYSSTLALYLVRRATFKPDVVDPTGDEYRKTWAWVLGRQLLQTYKKLNASTRRPHEAPRCKDRISRRH